MKIAKLFLPGRFEDIYVYMGRLIVLTEDRQLQAYNLEKIVQQIEKRFADTIPVPTWLFSRNDWLVNHQFKTLMRNEEIKQTFLRVADSLAQNTIEVNSQDILIEQMEINLSDPMILDLLIYNGRMYIGATNGLYHLDVDWKENGDVVIKSPQKRHEARCMNLSAHSGTVNASCDKDGLFTFIDEFGWWQKGEKKTILKVTDKSLMTTWLNQNIINYPSYDHLDMFRSQISKRDTNGLERENKVVTDVNLQAANLEYLLTQARVQYSINENDQVRYVYNSNNRLFIATHRNSFFSLPFGVTKDRREHKEQPSLKRGGRSQRIEGNIISIHYCKSGTILETTGSVVLAPNTGRENQKLLDEEVILVRTFPRSKRFQNLVAAVVEEGIFLMSIFDETEIGSEPVEEAFTF